ncbi:MAG: hypothetical protein IJV64_02610 [Oscillospiraceae bacterium]|nr:hypothetical protein [Oscillospiraceae bacterium]
MDERTTSYVENGQKKTGVVRPTYNPNTDYMLNMNRAAASGDNSAAAYYEQQRNDKIAATGSQYAPTALYAQYAQDLTPQRMTQLEQGYTPSYNPNTDYSSYMQKAAGAGDYGAAGYYEQQRNKKIQGEGLSYAPSSTYANYYDLVDAAQGAALENGYQTPAEKGYLNAAQEMISSNYNTQRAAADAESEAQKQLIAEQYARQREKLGASYAALERQLYTDMMDERRLLPEQLAAQGVNGGATESSLLRNRLAYEQALRANEAERISGGKDLDLAETQGTLQQEIARQQALRELASQYASQYASMMGDFQTQANYEAEQALQKQQLQLAYMQAAAETKAAAGDFSGYALLTDLNGNRLYSDDEIQKMQAYWQLQQAATGSGGSGGGYRRSSSSKSGSGSDSSDDYAAILAQLRGNSQVQGVEPKVSGNGWVSTGGGRKSASSDSNGTRWYTDPKTGAKYLIDN